jgi:succinate dehydrogenase / fumarate reductase cytochrome b subunit
MSARPVAYSKKATVVASLTSRTMMWTGAMIFLFVTYHILHFTVKATNPMYGELVDAAGRHDVYSMVVLGYQNVLISLTYFAAMLLLGFHLFHAIASMFQTMGVNHPVYTPMINKFGAVLAILIVVGFLSIPLGVLFGWIVLPAGVIVL